MHILLVNDDGIHAPGIRALSDACVARGHRVTVCAPHTERSASSHRITLSEPIYARETDYGHAQVRAWSISGTPADCVRIGLYELIDCPADVVISGINNGHNAGMAVHYSGTVAAAREGALNHVPAIAVSMAYEGTDTMRAYTAKLSVLAAEAYVQTAVHPQTVLNINTPAREPDDTLPPVMAPLSTAGYQDRYIRREAPRAGTYFWLSGGSEIEPSPAGSDVALLEAGHVTYTVIGNPCGFDTLGPDFMRQLTAQTPHA
jgi:5'-nucleotidase